jgi:predicted component of type VI protein secretion system
MTETDLHTADEAQGLPRQAEVAAAQVQRGKGKERMPGFRALPVALVLWLRPHGVLDLDMYIPNRRQVKSIEKVM